MKVDVWLLFRMELKDAGKNDGHLMVSELAKGIGSTLISLADGSASILLLQNSAALDKREKEYFVIPVSRTALLYSTMHFF